MKSRYVVVVNGKEYKFSSKQKFISFLLSRTHAGKSMNESVFWYDLEDPNSKFIRISKNV